MIILGIDPGYERVGIAILKKNSLANKKQKEEVVFSECFKTSKDLSFEERILKIGEEIEKIIKKYKPEVLAIENLFFTTNQKTVMRVAEARGAIIYEAKRNNLKIFEATPLQIKLAITGYGKANKEQINKMLKMIINIDKKISSDDELDAIATALCASFHLKS